MINVVLRNNVGFIVDGQRKATLTFPVTDDTTVGQFMEEHADVVYNGKTPMLNGVTIDEEIKAQTFAERANGMTTVHISYTKNSEGNAE